MKIKLKKLLICFSNNYNQIDKYLLKLIYQHINLKSKKFLNVLLDNIID